MPRARQVIFGLVIALLSLVIILGGFSLSYAEGRLSERAAPTSTIYLPPQLPTLPQPSATPVILVTPSLTMTPPPTPVNCPPPVDWVPYLVQIGDTWEKLASHYQNMTPQTLWERNCQTSSGILQPGTLIYLPPTPTPTHRPTSTSIPCGAPRGWVIYFVQQGDTLYRISQSFGNGLTVSDLQAANCMGSSTLLRTGQTIYVPPWPTLTPTPTMWFPVTDTPYLFPSDTPFPTETPTEIPSETPTP